MFTATLIFAISFLTLLQFFVSYSHSLIAELRLYELSQQTRELSGVTPKTVRGDQFKRLLQLIAICPESGEDSHQVRAVSAYFRMLGLVRALFSKVFPAAARWIDTERGGCTYVAAVVLDRRIAYNRTLKAQHAGIRL